MKKYLVLLVLGLTACNGPDIKVPISRFYGATVTLSSYETIQFNMSGAYVYNDKNKDCVKAGMWKDLDPGSKANLVQFTQKADGCVYPNSTEEIVFTYPYTVDDKNNIILVR